MRIQGLLVKNLGEGPGIGCRKQGQDSALDPPWGIAP